MILQLRIKPDGPDGFTWQAMALDEDETIVDDEGDDAPTMKDAARDALEWFVSLPGKATKRTKKIDFPVTPAVVSIADFARRKLEGEYLADLEARGVDVVLYARVDDATKTRVKTVRRVEVLTLEFTEATPISVLIKKVGTPKSYTWRALVYNAGDVMEWVERAACRGVTSAVFYPVGNVFEVDYDEAKAVCSVCPVVEQCGEQGKYERYGVWGGLDPSERRIANRRVRGPSRREGPIPHGTAGGAQAHRKRRIEMCEPCRLAELAYRNDYKNRKRQA